MKPFLKQRIFAVYISADGPPIEMAQKTKLFTESVSIQICQSRFVVFSPRFKAVEADLTEAAVTCPWVELGVSVGGLT